MLPKVHRRRYEELKQALEQLQQTAAGAELDASGLQLSKLGLRQRLLTAQQFFQQQVVSLDAGDLEPADEPRVRSYQTEMSKQMQLLGMDVMLWQAARQPGTAIGRQQQLRDRIQTLISYCDAILQLN
jgi:hypothetical protein